jgi:hypothetical protein
LIDHVPVFLGKSEERCNAELSTKSAATTTVSTTAAVVATATVELHAADRVNATTA